MSWTEEPVRLFVGGDWAEEHYDVELMDAAGRVLVRGEPGQGDGDPGGTAQRAQGQPPALTAAYAFTERSLIALISTLNEHIKVLHGQVQADFGRHPRRPDARRVRRRTAPVRRRRGCRNYTGTGPLTGASGRDGPGSSRASG